MGLPCFLKTMGYPELRTGDGRPFKLKVRKHLGLLVYLAVDGRSHHQREALVEMFWSRVPLDHGRHSLSMALTVLRSAVGREAIRSSGTQIRFAPGAVHLDLDRLTRGRTVGDAVTPELEVDRFLLDFEIPDAPAFQHWRDRQQAQLLPAIQSGILATIDHARRSGDMPRVMELAERLLAIDPLAEEGIRARMEGYALQGDRVSALRVYEDWKQALELELGAAPSELLEGIASRLRRRGLERPASAAGPSVQTEHWADRCFVGRAAEFRILFDAWEATIQLNTRHVLINGDTGVGKSTLAMRFGTAAALEGAAVARVQCFELEQRIAFGMIGALVGQLLDRPGAVSTAPSSLAEIARVVPRVRERFTNLPRPLQTEGEAARLHFAEGTFALFEAIMDEQPLVLIVDDYPRSDEASLSVLHMLLRRAGTERLMVVLTGRPPELDEPAQSERIRKGVSYLPMRRLDLRPMSPAESEELLTAALASSGKAPGLPERRAILRAAGGNPMAIELLAQDWAQHGDAAMAVSIPAMRAEVPISAIEAVSYDRVIERLLPALTPRTRAALHLAAILGPRLNELESFQIVDLTATQTMAAMNELIDRRVLRDAGAGLEFTNELIRARLYLKIPTAARVRLHDGVANRLLEAAARGDSVPGLEIAWHCIRARRKEEATPYLMSGARDAVLHGAPEEAARALSSALPHLRGRVKDEATLLLAETYQEMAQWEEARECTRSISSSSEQPPEVKEMRDALDVASKSELGEYDISVLPDLVEELIMRTRANQSISSRVRTGLIAAYLAGDLRSSHLVTRVEQALGEIDVLGLDHRQHAQLLLARGVTQYHNRQNSKGLDEALAAVEVLERAGATDSTYVRIQVGLGAIACANGDYTNGLHPLERAHAAAARLDNQHLMCMAATNLALCHYRLGNADEHARWTTTCVKLSGRLKPGSYNRIHSATHLARVHLLRNEAGATIAALSTLAEDTERATLSWVRQAGLFFQAEILWLLGKRERALRIVRRTLQLSQRPLSLGLAGCIGRWTSLLRIRDGIPAAAMPSLEGLYSQLPLFDAFDQAEILCSLALLLNCAGSGKIGVDAEARRAVALLPLACAGQLERLGLRLPA